MLLELKARKMLAGGKATEIWQIGISDLKGRHRRKCVCTSGLIDSTSTLTIPTVIQIKIYHAADGD